LRAGQPIRGALATIALSAGVMRPRPGTRITIRPHDPRTGDEIKKGKVVKGYEYSRGQFVTFSSEELKALHVESSKVIDLEKFVRRSELDPVYLDSAYYLYPDGPVAGRNRPAGIKNRHHMTYPDPTMCRQLGDAANRDLKSSTAFDFVTEAFAEVPETGKAQKLGGPVGHLPHGANTECVPV
jgi:hypothetical protein